MQLETAADKVVHSKPPQLLTLRKQIRNFRSQLLKLEVVVAIFVATGCREKVATSRTNPKDT
jgi:hypothetical protein